MSKWSERKRLVATIGIVVVVTGVLVALIVSDRSAIEAAEEEIAGFDARIHAADVEIRRTPDREDKVLVFRAVEDRELAVLPTKQKIADFHTNFSSFLSAANVRFVEMPESTAVESDLAKGIYVTRTTVSCEGDAASILKLVNMLENDPRLVAVKGLRMDARADRNREEEDEVAAHEVELTLETYFYNPEAGASEQVPIPGAERRLEDPAIQAAIGAFQPERPDTYSLRPAASRRDPFVDPRVVKTKEDPEQIAALHAQQEPVVIDLENRLRDIREKVEQAAELGAQSDLFRKAKIEDEIDDLVKDLVARLAQVDQMKTVTLSDLVERVGAARHVLDGMKTQRGPRETVVTKGVAETTLNDVRTLFEKGSYAEVESLANQWQQYLRGKTVDAEAAAFLAEIAAYRTRAKTLAEFKTKSIHVTGTIVNKQDPKRSIVVVNGRSLQTGEAVDEAGEVRVGTITDAGAEFHFKGETLFQPRERATVPDKKGGRKGTGRTAAPPAVPVRAPRDPEEKDE